MILQLTHNLFSSNSCLAGCKGTKQLLPTDEVFGMNDRPDQVLRRDPRDTDGSSQQAAPRNEDPPAEETRMMESAPKANTAVSRCRLMLMLSRTAGIDHHNLPCSTANRQSNTKPYSQTGPEIRRDVLEEKPQVIPVDERTCCSFLKAKNVLCQAVQGHFCGPKQRCDLIPNFLTAYTALKSIARSSTKIPYYCQPVNGSTNVHNSRSFTTLLAMCKRVNTAKKYPDPILKSF